MYDNDREEEDEGRKMGMSRFASWFASRARLVANKSPTRMTGNSDVA